MLQDLRAGLLAVIQSLPGGPFQRAVDLQRALGIGATVAWQVHRTAGAGDPIAAGLEAPGVAALRRVLRLARSRGAAAEPAAALQSAIDRFERLIKDEAGDRGTFDTMLKATGDAAAAGLISTSQRRAAFRSNSAIWGVQARVGLWSTLYTPGHEPGRLQSANLRGYIDRRRLRADAPCVVSRYRSLRAGGEPVAAEPVFLSRFSVSARPLLTRIDADGFLVTEMPGEQIGNESLATYFLANFNPEAPWYETDRPMQTISNFVRVGIPIETLILDTLCHHEFFGRLAPAMIVHASLARMAEIDPERFKGTERLPLAASAKYLGRGPAAARCADVPRYTEMLEHICAREYWDRPGGPGGLESFDVYRCRLEYPILSAVHEMRFEFPARPPYEPAE